MATISSEPPRTIISRAELSKRVTELGQAISSDLAGLPLTALIVLNGAFIFAADLLREINHDNIRVDFIQASSYHGKFEKTALTTLSGRISDLDPNRHILIIEDIVDTGETLESIKNSLLNTRVPSVRTVALLEKRDRRTHDVVLDYVGFRFDGCYMYGYGLDQDDLLRNLAYVEGWPAKS